MRKTSKVLAFALALVLVIGGAGQTALAADGDLYRASLHVDKTGEYGGISAYSVYFSVSISGLGLGISESDFSNIVVYRDGKADGEPSSNVAVDFIETNEHNRNTHVTVYFSHSVSFPGIAGSYHATFTFRGKNYKTNTKVINMQGIISEEDTFIGDPVPENIWLNSALLIPNENPGADPSDASTYTMSAVNGLRLFTQDEEGLLSEGDIDNIVLYKDGQKLQAPFVSKIEETKNVMSDGSDNYHNLSVDFSPSVPAGPGVYYATFQFRGNFYHSNSLICKADGTYVFDSTDFKQISSGEIAPITTAPAQPAIPETPAGLTAAPTASTVLVNGKNVAFDAYNIEGNNYFKLRDLAYILNGTAKQFEVGWDGANNAILLTSGKAYSVAGGEMTGKGAGNKTATPTSSKILLDGQEVSFTAYNIEGNNYFKLRDVGQTFNFGVDWDGANNTIVIDTSKGYTPEGAVTTPVLDTFDNSGSTIIGSGEYPLVDASPVPMASDDGTGQIVGIAGLQLGFSGRKPSFDESKISDIVLYVNGVKRDVGLFLDDYTFYSEDEGVTWFIFSLDSIIFEKPASYRFTFIYDGVQQESDILEVE